MQFVISRDVFLKALSKIQSVVEKRHTIPILSNVLIETFDNELCLTATDLEVGLQSRYEVKVEKKGKITISAKKIFEIIKELPDKEIVFSSKDNGWIEIRCGKSIFNVVGLSADEFPPFPNFNIQNNIEIESSIVRDMLEKTSFSMSTDETKYNLNGIFIKKVEKDKQTALLFVATDGHRLSLIEKNIKVSSFNEIEKGVILPRKGIFELKKLCEENETSIKLNFSENNAIAIKDNTILVMRLIDGDFPDFTRVIPKESPNCAIMDREQLMHSLRRISVLSNEKSRGVRLSFSSTGLELSSSQSEVGEAREEIEADYSGVNVSIGFNAKYLIDILQALTEEKIEFSLRDTISPGCIRPAGNNGFLSVVMPMRL